MPATHVIGLLLGAEEDWPAAFESLLDRVAPAIKHQGTTHRFTTERVTIEPFDLRMVPKHSLIIDRLAWWYQQSKYQPEDSGRYPIVRVWEKNW